MGHALGARLLGRVEIQGLMKGPNPMPKQLASSIILGLLLVLPMIIVAQEAANDATAHYRTAMKQYQEGDYTSAATQFQKFLDASEVPSEHRLYNGACIFALAGKSDRALEVLETLVSVHLYSNLDHVSSDSDLNSLHENPRWAALIEKVKVNKSTQPKRTRELIKTQLLKAKEILTSEGGKLWGISIWSTDILVLDFDNTIYSLVKLPGCKTDDGVLFYKSIPQNTLSFTNSAQTYEGKRYAIVLTSYLDDDCSTIIHELFHVQQLKVRQFRSDPVNYLDEHEARVLMRLEFQALRNALAAANDNQKSKVGRFLSDAAAFRKIRQAENAGSLRDELEIETLEGMANYTGIKLSTVENKYLEAIDEINGREAASTYTRPFPYATGPAYGLIFDYLDIQWRSDDMHTIYDFRKIYESHHGEALVVSDVAIEQAKSRNNFAEISAEETARKKQHEENIVHYTRMLVSQPTLTAKLSAGNESYSMSYDMNGTLVLGNEGIVYSQIKGVDLSGGNFGNFSTIAGKDRLGVGGILIREDGTFVFPLPVKIDGQKIIGETYEIDLNDLWTVRKLNDQGDLEIVRRK